MGPNFDWLNKCLKLVTVEMILPSLSFHNKAILKKKVYSIDLI